MTNRYLAAILILALLVPGLFGCGSGSDGTADTQTSEARQARAEAKAQARAVHRRAVARRQARIRARRQARVQARRLAHRAAVRQHQAEAEEAAARHAEEEAAPEEATSECDPNYSGCLSPAASDYDCEGGSGDGPEYTGTVTVTGEDHYGLDSDSDGVGCEP